MIKFSPSYKSFLVFVAKFLLLYTILYYGCMFLIGASVPGGVYSRFVEKYFDIAAFVRFSLINSAQFVLGIFSVNTIKVGETVIRQVNGNGIRIVFACLGFAVMCFWAAYVFANTIKLSRKLKWLVVGLLIIFCINVGRICLVLVSVNTQWPSIGIIDHHTWFNITAYLAIFILIFFFEKSNQTPKISG